MRKQPKLTKPTDVFRRKIVVTFPPWGVFVFAGIVGLSIGVQITRMLVIFLFIVVLCSLTATWAQHRMVNELRYSIHNLLHDIENDGRYGDEPFSTFEPYTPDDSPAIERIPVKDIKLNGTRNTRVSKRS